MKHFIACRRIPRKIPFAILSGLFLMCMMVTTAFAQHVGGAAHVGAPPVSHPVVSHPIAPVRPPIMNPGTRSFLVRPPAYQILPPSGFRIGYPYHPFPHRPPIHPIFPISPFGFGLFGYPFFGWGFNSGVAPACDPFWGWNYGCSILSPYESGFGYGGYSSGPENPQPQLEIQNWPVYYGEPNSQYVQLYLKDGAIYNVTDYWLVNGVLHFKLFDAAAMKVVEQAIDFDSLDLQKTIDVNTERGFRFVLRNEPLEDYLKDHPPSGPLE